MSAIRQAMLLAAGYATRLRPLTDEIPKPMLPFAGSTLFDLTLRYLAGFGVERVAVNVHHGRDRFLKFIFDGTWPVDVVPFVEETILGTGGGIRNMAPFVTEENFLVLNCDFLTDADLAAAAEFHLKKHSLATMVLVSPEHPERYGSVGVDGRDRIVEFPHGTPPGGAVRKGVFSGIHLFHRKTFDEMPDRDVFCINREVYAPLIQRGAPVHGFLTQARWLDVGDLASYTAAQKLWWG